MRTHTLFAFIALSALGLSLSTGCGGDDTSGSSSTSGGGGGPGGTGTAKDTWLTDSGEINDVPRPTLKVSAVFRSGDRWSEIAGTYDAATGTFSIEDVPEGGYYLRVGKDEYFATTARAGASLST